MQRAIAYIRVSTDRQAKRGTSLLTQRKLVLEYSALKGYELIRRFAEEGQSAKTDDRPILQQMLQYCKENKGRIDVLIFPKIDRFARYAADYHYLKGYLRDLGIRVESIDEHFDDSPAGRFMESLLAATAQFDNDVRSERALNGMKEAVALHRWPWTAPLGYRKVRIGTKATIEPDPRTAPLIRQVFETLALGQARPLEARRWLAQQGVVTGRTQFYRMICNKVYIGVIEAFGQIQQGAPPFVPLVSEATFLRARDAFRIHRGPKTYQRDHPDFPLRGTLHCSCGSLLTACWAKGRSERYPYYRCKTCARMNVHQSAAHHGFLEYLRFLETCYDFTPETKDRLKAEWKNDVALLEKRRRQLAEELVTLRELQKGISLKNAMGVVPDDIAQEQIAELEQKLMEKRRQLSDCQTGHIDIEVVIRHGQDFLGGLRSYWRDSNLDTKKHIQRFFLPSGATAEFDQQSRTAEITPLTGVQRAIPSKLSGEARHVHKTPNRKRRASRYQSTVVRASPRELIQQLIDLYREFGPKE